MRPIPFILFLILTIFLVITLNSKLLLPAPLGKLLAPQEGVWQNAEASDESFSMDLSLPGLKGKADVYFDERLVPHVFADNENDLYFIQGFLHAKFRLWQMELQSLAAAGRASEVIGEKGLDHDREFRRMGMVYAAENSLREMENSPETKSSCDAYTAGVNAYIHQLTAATLPLEYKLIGYKPEEWSNLKTALFLKYMSYDLAGHDNDFEMTNAKSFFSSEDFNLLFPAIGDSLDPIIPKGTTFLPPGIDVKTNIPDTARVNPVKAEETHKPDPSNGSNNWAVSGSRTASGAPILCNDPHLGLNLPSLWYEIQLSTAGFNAYGVSFPGAPGVIIGYNDSCAFGFTNGGRDVRDYYEVKFQDDSRKMYWFDSAWHPTTFRVEQIHVAGGVDVLDTVAYTNIGPVIYDTRFGGKRSTDGKSYALRWKAHDHSNELLIFRNLDAAKNYSDYQHAVQYLHTPGQNCVFASKSGDIALYTQGEFPAKWKGQGDFVMDGSDSTYLWRGMIPQQETPYQYNPERGFVSSANQRPVDSTYPYYLGREYPFARGFLINRKLQAMQQGITVQDMMAMQTDNYNLVAEFLRPLFLKSFPTQSLDTIELAYYDQMNTWNLRNDIHEKGATVFDVYWDQLRHSLIDDEYAKAPQPVQRPLEETLLEALLRDSAFKFIDDINTPTKESLSDLMAAAFHKAAAKLDSINAAGHLEWGSFKDTRINHLTKLPALSRLHLPIGGGVNMINATKSEHGPSWRMVVELTNETQAYGVYPGGQSGNPGSRFYDSFVDQWVAGKYYQLWMMKKSETTDPRVKWTMHFSPAV